MLKINYSDMRDDNDDDYNIKSDGSKPLMHDSCYGGICSKHLNGDLSVWSCKPLLCMFIKSDSYAVIKGRL